jgi:cobalamin-dependent methionine synthase I
MGVTFFDRKLLQEHPLCHDSRVMDEVSFGLSGSVRQFIGLFKRYWKLEE